MKFISSKYKIKGNISVLIILVLLASSMIGILTMGFLKQMISYTNDIYSYHKSYYLSKAGLELALVEINNSDIGFSNNISDLSPIFYENFDCENCKFNTDIKGNSQYLSNKFWLSDECNNETAFFIKGGESLVLPLFLQSPITTNTDVFNSQKTYDFSPLKYRYYLRFIQNQPYNADVNLGIIILSGMDVQRDYLFIKSYETNTDMFQTYFQEFDNQYGKVLDNKNFFSYMIISNAGNQDLSFCVFFEDFQQGGLVKSARLPTHNFFISSVASYYNKTVGLQAIFGQPIPGFLASSHLQ